ncbi:MAG: EamA family transporter [Nanoarchaeota archaeon]|nr:EamA family transporter [Nanoarchaeota archaeon]
MATQLWAITTVLFGTIIGSFGALYFKIGSETISIDVKKLIKNHKLILGFVFYGISSIFFIIALTGGELSVLYPLCAASYIWVCLLSMKFLNEKMNKLKWLGIITIIIGITFIGFGR